MQGHQGFDKKNVIIQNVYLIIDLNMYYIYCIYKDYESFEHFCQPSIRLTDAYLRKNMVKTERNKNN